MSVHEGQRRQGRLSALNKCRELTLYSLNILKNENTFDTLEGQAEERQPSRVKQKLIDEMIQHSENVYKYAWLGHFIHVDKATDWARRESYQRNAIESCNLLLVTIGMAKTLFHLKTKRIEYWAKLILDTRKSLYDHHATESQTFERFREQVNFIEPITLASEEAELDFLDFLC